MLQTIRFWPTSAPGDGRVLSAVPRANCRTDFSAKDTESSGFVKQCEKSEIACDVADRFSGLQEIDAFTTIESPLAIFSTRP